MIFGMGLSQFLNFFIGNVPFLLYFLIIDLAVVVLILSFLAALEIELPELITISTNYCRF